MALSLATICAVVINKHNIIAPCRLQWLVGTHNKCSICSCRNLLGHHTKIVNEQIVCGKCTCIVCNEVLPNTTLAELALMHYGCYVSMFNCTWPGPVLSWGRDFRWAGAIVNKNGYCISMSIYGPFDGRISIRAPGVNICSFFDINDTRLILRAWDEKNEYLEEYLYKLVTYPLERIPYEISYILGPISDKLDIPWH